MPEKLSKRVDVKAGGIVILPAIPAGSTVRVKSCGRAGVSLEFTLSDPDRALLIADRRGNAILLESRAVAV